MNYSTIRNKYRPKKYVVGDHLFFDKAFDTPGLSHHGVYNGYNEVIHFWNPSGEKDKDGASVQVIPLSAFEQLAHNRGSKVFVVEHGRNRLPRRESVRRARAELGQGGYNALTNNCEHFVNFCVLGTRTSFQVSSPPRYSPAYLS